MSDYIIGDGPFARACAELIQRHHYQIPYWDRSMRIRQANGEAGTVTSPSARRNKNKYSCPSCPLNVWGKPNVKVICGESRELLEAV